MNVLLTNDDGINAAGLRKMFKALVERGHKVQVVAPMHQQSGVGHSLTVFEPLRSESITEDNFSGTGIYGTPTDCVKLGLASLCVPQPDLVISGINLGPNVGLDIFYSGTVGAAAEAAHASVPSMAVSWHGFEANDMLEIIAGHAAELAEKISWSRLPPNRVVNVNYPADAQNARGIQVCPQSLTPWRNKYSERNDPRGSKYWWLEGDIEGDMILDGTDRDLLAKGYITITPLKFEYTDHDTLDMLRQMEEN